MTTVLSPISDLIRASSAAGSMGAGALSASAATAAGLRGSPGFQNITLLAKLSSLWAMSPFSSSTTKRMSGSALSPPALATSSFSPSERFSARERPIRALRAALSGCSSCGRGWPGAGGRRAKSGGTTRGAFETTRNSSGVTLVMPRAWRVDWQPERPVAPARTAMTAMCWNFIKTRLLGPPPATPSR